MDTHLLQELEKIQIELMAMFAQVEEALVLSIRALSDRDEDLSQEVIDSDVKTNTMEVTIDELCLKLLAREQPVAKDLRYTIGYSRIAIDLERIGDQAVNIAERSIMLANRPPIPSSFIEDMQELASKTMEMYRNAVHVLVNRDPDGAVNVCEADTVVDKLYIKLIKKLLDYLDEEPKMVERPVHMIMVAKAFERIADLATNIAETVVFMVQGIDIRHSCQFDNVRMNSGDD